MVALGLAPVPLSEDHFETRWNGFGQHGREALPWTGRGGRQCSGPRQHTLPWESGVHPQNKDEAALHDRVIKEKAGQRTRCWVHPPEACTASTALPRGRPLAGGPAEQGHGQSSPGGGRNSDTSSVAAAVASMRPQVWPEAGSWGGERD